MSKPLLDRGRLARFFSFAVMFGSAGILGVAAQPPSEVEESRPKPPKKITVDDGDVRSPSRKKGGEEDLVSGTGVPPDVRLEELIRAAEQSQSPALKEVLQKYVVPFDRLTEGTQTSRVKPVPFRLSEWKGAATVGINFFDNSGKAKELKAVNVKDVKTVEHFETIVQAEADRLLKEKVEGATPADQLSAAEKLLSAALRFHDYSRIPRVVDGTPRNLRRGKGWEDIHDSTATRLRTIQLELLKALVAAKDPARIQELTRRMVVAYPNDAEVAKAVSTIQVAEAERLIALGTDQDCYNARRVLDELESAFPGAGGEAVKKIRAKLHEMAVTAIKRAREKKAVGDDRTARTELARAISFEPEAEGIRDLQRDLQTEYPILYVGVREYPQNMSPTTAKLDSEKQVVELLFEGLLEEVPDESGAVRYRPGASFDPPLAFPGGREFLLRTFPQDPQGRPGFESRDVLETITYLRSRPELWVSYPMGWFAPDQPPLRDSQSIRIAFGVAHPDPRSLLTFKILPMRYLQSNSWTPDDPRFAEKPFGTGPFRLHSNPKSDGKGSAREMVFVNNPTYGRADRAGLPFLREVRFVEANKVDTVKAFLEGKLHLLPDVPTAEIDRYQDAASGLKGKVDVVTAKVNRRVHILAVNLRRPYLQNKNLRQGLSYAINRDEILRKEFRANKVDVHKAMTGPFPPGSWATSRGPGGESPLFSKDLALVRLKAYLAADPNAETTIKLAYSQNDPSADKACQEIKKQIEDLFKADAGGGKKLTIQLEKMPIERLLSAVQEQHASFDLAYVPFDYPDDWYPLALGAALDPEASKQRNGRNWFGFRDDTTNPDAADQQLGRDLAKLRGYRDFSGELVPQAIAVTKQFNESLPFIPLWQLDRHMVVSRKLKISLDETSATGGADLLNQTTLFQGVGRWRVD